MLTSLHEGAREICLTIFAITVLHGEEGGYLKGRRNSIRTRSNSRVNGYAVTVKTNGFSRSDEY